MKTLTYTVTIDRPANIVFNTMTNNLIFPDWAKAWGEGMICDGKWKKGEHLTFTDAAGSGTRAIVEEVQPNELVKMKHVAMVEGRNRDIVDPDEKMKKWIGSQEDYHFIDNGNGTTTVKVVLAVDEDFEEMMSAWNQALGYLKSVCETG